MDYSALKLASKRAAKRAKARAPAAKPKVAATSPAKPTAAISGTVHAKVTAAAPKVPALPAEKVAAKEAPGSIWAQAHASLLQGEAK